jgi:hypothetical protein
MTCLIDGDAALISAATGTNEASTQQDLWFGIVDLRKQFGHRVAGIKRHDHATEPQHAIVVFDVEIAAVRQHGDTIARFDTEVSQNGRKPGNAIGKLRPGPTFLTKHQRGAITVLRGPLLQILSESHTALP